MQILVDRRWSFLLVMIVTMLAAAGIKARADPPVPERLFTSVFPTPRPMPSFTLTGIDGSIFHIPSGLVVRGATAHRNPPEVRICR